MEKIFTLDKSRSKFLALAGLSDSATLFQKPNKSKWKKLQKNLTPYKPLLGHFCTYSYLKEPKAYMVIKKFVGLRAEFYGMSLLTMAAPILKNLLHPYNALLSFSETTNVNNLVKLCASLMLYFSENPESAIHFWGDTYPELKKMTMDDARAGKFARLFSADYMPWLSYKKESKLAIKIAGLNAGVKGDLHDPKPSLGISIRDGDYLKALKAGIQLSNEDDDKDELTSDLWRKIKKESTERLLKELYKLELMNLFD